jgi:hypothetical protein
MVCIICYNISIILIYFGIKEMDRLIAQGENSLHNMREQNSMLKEVKRKMLNVANTLGLSGTLIR